MDNEKLSLRKAKILILNTVDNMDTEIFEMCTIAKLDSLVDKYSHQYLEKVKVLDIKPDALKLLKTDLNAQLESLVEYYKDPKWAYLFSK